jgi:hypothetical protein
VLNRCALPLLVAAALGAGCGASGRADDATTVAVRFQTALDRRDGGAACAQLSEETAAKLEQQEQRPCEEAILELELPSGGTPSQADVYVTSAAVGVTTGGTLFLNEAPGGWEISAAGCRPTAPQLPYDCELED